MTADSPKLDPTQVQLLADHYQKTFELADDLREDRNKFFIFLVIVLAGATVLLSLGKDRALKMLAAWISASISFDTLDQKVFADLAPDRIADWLLGKDFALLLALTLAIVFYLMMNLYHHTATVKRLYIYLAELEKEIGQTLSPNGMLVAFTREGKFYDAYDWIELRSIGVAYSIVLSIMLGGFFVMVWQDLLSSPPTDGWTGGIRIADVIITFATLAYLVAYWLVPIRFSRFRKSQAGQQTPNIRTTSAG